MSVASDTLKNTSGGERGEAPVTPHKHYMPALDGLRAFACLLVVIGHIDWMFDLAYDRKMTMGAIGVAIFFSLSGFLMGSLYLRTELTIAAAVKYGIARFSRIVPAYYIALAFVCALYAIDPSFYFKMDPDTALRHFLFIGSRPVFWSISPEVQFYGFFLLFWAAIFFFPRRKIVLFAFLALSAGLIATREQWGGIMLPSKLHLFLFGASIALALSVPKIAGILQNPFVQAPIFLAGIVYALFIPIEGLYADLFFAGTIAVCVAAASRSSALTRPFETRWMRDIGNASFSIYLFHFPILKLLEGPVIRPENGLYANIAIACAVSIALPVMFHVFAEKPLNTKTREMLMALFQRRD